MGQKMIYLNHEGERWDRNQKVQGLRWWLTYWEDTQAVSLYAAPTDEMQKGNTCNGRRKKVIKKESKTGMIEDEGAYWKWNKRQKELNDYKEPREQTKGRTGNKTKRDCSAKEKKVKNGAG